MRTKPELRKSITTTLKAVDEATFLYRCQTMYPHLFEQREWTQSRTIAVTVSRGREVHTSPIIEKAWYDGKRVVVPKCLPETKQLQFRELTKYDELEEVFFGLKEPKVEETKAVDSDAIDLIVVPGLLFDESGYRIGFGGGYYDRYLSTYKGQTIALCLNEQLVEGLPHEAFDIPVQKIVTPSRVYNCL